LLEKSYLKDLVEAGCDEAGRGCLAGPVFAGAVILPAEFGEPLLDDSKKLSEKKRYELRQVIEDNATAFAVGICSNEEIDDLNILNASILAMHRALDGLSSRPQHILVDGNQFAPYYNTPHKTIIKGDGKFQSIAAASILAKTYRDDFMKQIDSEFPEYGWSRNKGYPTIEHRKAILINGITKFHRRSFNLYSIQLKIDYS
jgi:ribonuclease HII